jgi:hypothetical protein
MRVYTDHNIIDRFLYYYTPYVAKATGCHGSCQSRITLDNNTIKSCFVVFKVF